MKKEFSTVRWLYLILGTSVLLCVGIIYAWSILKAPLAEEFSWTPHQLAINFTLTICTFCLGAFLGGLCSKRLGIRLCLFLSAFLAGIGFVLTSHLSGQNIANLYMTYGILAGLGIGIAYNVIIATVCAWFPDKKGLCSGTLLMGFGSSALVVGTLVSRLIETQGWRSAYFYIGIALTAVLAFAALILHSPDADMASPHVGKECHTAGDEAVSIDYTTAQMVRLPSFWIAFLCIASLSAVGNTVISIASDLAISVGAGVSFAATLVGMLSVCNGLGRIIIGALFDRFGRKKTMFFANYLAISAAGVTLIATVKHSLPLCVLGMCLVGFSYGAGPTMTSAVTSAFYGKKHFSLNFSVMNFNLMVASVMASVSSWLLEISGSYTIPILFLLGLATISLILNICLKQP